MIVPSPKTTRAASLACEDANEYRAEECMRFYFRTQKVCVTVAYCYRITYHDHE